MYTSVLASTQWAVRNFNAWSVERSKLSDAQAVPPDILKSHDAELVCLWMCRFVMETRKTDGSRYPPASIRSMVSGLNRVLKENKAPFSVLDKTDYRNMFILHLNILVILCLSFVNTWKKKHSSQENREQFS